MHTERTIEINAEPARVWAVMSDVEGWPEWTDTVNSIALTPPGPLALGSEARIAQPRFGTRTWQVTSLEPGTAFAWETRSPGVVMVGRHAIAPRPAAAPRCGWKKSTPAAGPSRFWVADGRHRPPLREHGGGEPEAPRRGRTVCLRLP